jgi:hypothetical protein
MPSLRFGIDCGPLGKDGIFTPPQWTPQIRPLIDTAKPATTPAS